MAQCRIAVVGSINVDIAVLAERIPLKGETVYGGDVLYSPGVRAPIRRLPAQGLERRSKCLDALAMMRMEKECFIIWKKTVWEPAISKYWRERIQVLH